MWRILMVALVAAASALACRLTISPADAQAIPKSLQEGGAEAAIKLRKNNWTVGVVGGLIDGTYMRFADELGKALDDGDNLRILPIVS
jgi:molybdopterin converting factor small subunit